MMAPKASIRGLRIVPEVIEYFLILTKDLRSKSPDRPQKIGTFAFSWIIFNHCYRTVYPYGKKECVECKPEYKALKKFYKNYDLECVFNKTKNEQHVKQLKITEEPFSKIQVTVPTNKAEADYIKDFLLANQHLAKHVVEDFDNNNLELKYHKLDDFKEVYDYLCLMYLVRNFIIHGSPFLKNKELNDLLDFSVKTFTVFIDHLLEEIKLKNS
jgi:hypothetical protein